MITNAGTLCPEVTMKKLLCLLLCVMFCVSALTGCGRLKEDEKGAHIRMYLGDYPYTLDPAVVQLNSDVDQILSMIYEPLTTIDEKGKVQPALATKWYYDYDEIFRKHRMYFELKETKWSDNRAVSADDVIYAWRRILSPEIDSPYASILYCIEGARSVKSGVNTIDDLGLAAADDTLLEVTFEEGLFGYEEADQEAAAAYCELFAEQVANVHLAPQREDIVTRYEKLGEDWSSDAASIVCNGPFRIQAMDMPRPKKDSDTGNTNYTCKLVLERNTYYMRNPEKDKLDKYVLPYRITCYYLEGQHEYYNYESAPTQQVFQADLFNNNEIFYLGDFEKQTYEYFGKSVKSQQTLNGFGFYFNNANEILADADVRNALSLALDRTAITEMLGTGEVAATGIVPNGVFNTGRKDDFREEGGDLYSTSAKPDEAKALLSGKKKGSLKLVYLIPQNSDTYKYAKRYVNYVNVYEDVAKAAAESWKALGFDIELVGLYTDEYLAALKERNYDIIGTNITYGSTDAFAYLAPYAKEYSGTGVVLDNDTSDIQEVFNLHYTNYDNAEYTALIDAALATGDRAERAAKLHEAEEKLVEDCPATMVFWYSRNYVSSNKISGFKTDSWFGYVDFTEVTLKNWRKVNAKEEEISAARTED